MLCIGVERKRVRFHFNSKIDFQFLCGVVGRKPKEASGEVDDITAGMTSEAVEAVIHFHTGIVILMEWTSYHAASVY